MAKVKVNSVFNGFRGKLGGVVFRNYNGRTIVAKAPGKKRQPISEKQQRQQQLFRMASQYARGVTADPERSAELAAKLKPGESVYRLALKEFLDSRKGKP